MKKIILGLLTAAALHAQPWVDHLGVQMWSLHKIFDQDPNQGFQAIESFGLKYVETAGLYKMPVQNFNDALRAHRLVAISAHVQYGDLEKDPAAVIEQVKALKVKYAVVPWIPHEGDFTEADGHRAAENFNRWGAAFRAEGIQFGWHPHGFEFKPGANGQTPFDIIVHETDPKNLLLEMDVFWVYHAGNDPVTLLKKYPNRWRLMHVKDMRNGAKTGFYTGHAEESDNVAVGSGQIDWPAVLKTAKDVGIQWYFIEDETSDPMKNVPESIRYLKSIK